MESFQPGDLRCCKLNLRSSESRDTCSITEFFVVVGNFPVGLTGGWKISNRAGLGGCLWLGGSQAMQTIFEQL